jgi:hypothetical protein
MKFLKIAFLSIILFSCKKVEFDKISSSFWNPKLAVPLAYGSFTINDILKQADSINKYIDPNARPTLQFSTTQSIDGFSLTDAVKLPDFNTLPPQSIYSFSKLTQNDINQINLVASGNVGNEIDFGAILKQLDPNTNFNQSIPIDFSSGSDLPSDFRVDRIDFTSGKIQINVTKGLPYKTVLKFTFNEIKKNGNKLVDSVVFMPNSNVPIEIDLAGYYADFSSKQLSYSIDKMTITPTNTNITSNDQIILGVSMTNLGFKSIQGYFGNLSIPPISDTFSIDQLKDLKGKFGITNPSISLKVVNGFGIPVELGFDKFAVIRKDNSTYPINVNAPFQIGYPKKMGDANVTSTLELNKSTVTNIDKLLSSETKVVQLGGSLSVNKDGEIVGQPNFITDQSTIALEAQVSVPLTGYVSGFTFEDTSDISLPFEMLKSFNLKVLYNNSLPVDITGSIKFLDKNGKLIKDVNGKVIDLLSSSNNKLFKSPTLKYDATTASYILTKTEAENVPTQEINLTLTEAQIASLKDVAKVIFTGSFETFGGSEEKPITLFDYYGVSIKLAGNAQVDSKGLNTKK